MMAITFYPTVSCGELGKYATMPRALLPASSWAGYELRERGLDAQGYVRKIPVPNIPATLIDIAADCGGFVATKKWGRYLYTPEQYVTWLEALRPTWAAMMDFCCEDQITSGIADVVRSRQDQTTEMARYLWQEYRSSSWVWVPTIQGWHVAEYYRHVQEMKPLIREMQAHYGIESAFRVGIGTLCARASAKMIREVVTMVSHELSGVPLHLWGVKLSVLQSPIHVPAQVASVDSAAWNGMFKTGREKWKGSGLSQRQYCFEVALPAYEAKISAALAQPKQMSMEDIA